ncbi:MAG: DNA internalization-related competence protein ComEC/Rec2 [Gammaproteobacteria bacterium]|nr:DNA internalization-related competence protein ComEC/Rec2 [Gammaproteobacteria bacterium]
MILAAVSFLAGVVLLQWQPSLPPAIWSGFLLLLPLVLWKRQLLLPLLFLSGFLWASIHAHWQLSDPFPVSLEGQDLTITGVVDGLPVRKERQLRFDLLVELAELEGEGVPFSGKVRVNWYNHFPKLSPGERWQFTLRLKRPHGYANPGGFDYEAWLFRQGIKATGYVRDAGSAVRVQENVPGNLIDRWRQQIRIQIDHLLQDHPGAGLIKAMVIGDRSGVSQENWKRLTNSGTNHLVAISGLHIGLIAGLGFLIGKWLWRRSAKLCLGVPAPIAGALLALVMATLYAALAGFSLPTQRALIMLLVVMGGVLLRRSTQPGHSLAVALFLILLFDPMSVLSPGFWLSFVAVVVILFAITGRLQTQGLWWRWGRIQWVVAIGLFPVLLAWGAKVSLMAPLINLIAVPLVSLVILPMALLGTGLLDVWPEGSGAILSLTAELLALSMSLLENVEPFNPTWRQSGSLPLLLWLSVGVGVLLFLAPRGVPGRYLGVILILPLVAHQNPRPAEKAFWFDLLDVGQGLSAVIMTRNHTLVYDVGPSFSSGFNTGDTVVVPFLSSRGIDSVERVVLSNGDRDHQGGYSGLISDIEVGILASGEPRRIPQPSVTSCNRGESWNWDGVQFQFLHPESDRQWRGNNASCVLQVRAPGGRLLITGDIERRAENVLLSSGQMLKSDIVVIPHHGSKSSSTAPFVAAVSPQYALVPAGYRNRYHFPHQSVVARWEQQGARVLGTAAFGNISFKVTPEEGISTPQRYRCQIQRYWSQNPCTQSER